MTTASPLSWPAGWPRTSIGNRKSAQFSKAAQSEIGSYNTKRPLTISDATNRLKSELGRLKVNPGSVILSTNLRLRQDGLPYSDQRMPEDCGAAVYFKIAGKDRVLACDKWNRVADNIAALAAHIDAIRRQERYGVGTMEQAFAGYAALPAPDRPKPWWQILGLQEGSTLAEAEAAYRALVKINHPDAGGSVDAMMELNRAIHEARAL